MFLLGWCCCKSYVITTIASVWNPPNGKSRRSNNHPKARNTTAQGLGFGSTAHELLVLLVLLLLATCSEGNHRRIYKQRHNLFSKTKVVKIFATINSQKHYLCVIHQKRSIMQGTLYTELAETRNYEIPGMPKCHRLFNVEFTQQNRLILGPYIEPKHQRLYVRKGPGRKKNRMKASRKKLQIGSMDFENVARYIKSGDQDFELEYETCPEGANRSAVSNMPPFRIRLRKKIAYVKARKNGQVSLVLNNWLLQSIVKEANMTGNPFDAFSKSFFDGKCTQRQVVAALLNHNCTKVDRFQSFVNNHSTVFRFEVPNQSEME